MYGAERSNWSAIWFARERAHFRLWLSKIVVITLFRPCLVLDGGCLESRPIYRKIGKRPTSGLGTGSALLYACGEQSVGANKPPMGACASDGCSVGGLFARTAPSEFLYTCGDFNPDCALVHLAAHQQLFTT